MSVEVSVFLYDDDLPTHDVWQRAVDTDGHDLQLDAFSPRTHSGFLPSKLGGQDCGFEYSFGSIDDDIIIDLGDQIGSRDRIVSFVWHSSELDMRAGILAAAVLAKMTEGIYFDPQSGECVQGSSVYELIRQQEAEEYERRMRLAIQKWGTITDRRCPKCAAPCPEYKKTCSVCGQEVGRAKGT